MDADPQGIAKTRNRYQVIPRTLCFITNGDDVLLLRGGSQKRLWAGLYNGVGGHVERCEDIYTATTREVEEETGLQVRDLRLCGVVHVDGGDPTLGILFFVFRASTPERRVAPSEEGSLEWVAATHLPAAAEMVEDLPFLLPRVLAMSPADPPFFAAYRYDAGGKLVVSFA